MKRLISILLMLTVVSSGLAGCSSKSTADTSSSGSSGDIVTIKYVGPGTPPDGLDRITADLNKMMVDDGLNINVEFEFIPWDAWSQKTNMMLSTGEEFDLLEIQENGTPTANYVMLGALTPLDDYISQIPGFKDLFKDYEWQACQVKGTTYSVPNIWSNPNDLNGQVGTITLRQDILDDLGLPLPTNADELLSTMEAIKNWYPADKNVYAWEQDITRTPVYLHRTYDTWPFYVDFTNSLIYVDESGNVKSWLETPEFKQDCEFYRKLYTEGITDPDVLSMPPDQRSQAETTGDFIAGLGTFGLYDQANYNKLDNGVKVSEFYLEPDEPSYVFMPVQNSNGVSVTSKHPLEALEFLNFIYTNQDASDLLLLGEDGVDYQINDDGLYDQILPVDASSTTPPYYFPSWQIGYAPLIRYPEGTDSDYIYRQTHQSESDQISIVSGFAFDYSPVKSQYANCMSVWTSDILPIKEGVVDYDEAYPAAIDKMKKAGLDDVVAEYDKQFHEWLSAKNSN